MGYSFRGICHTLKIEADTAFCESLTISGLQSNGAFMSQSCESLTDTTATISKILDTVTSSQTVALPSYLVCAHDGGSSLALEYFGLGIGLLAVIFAAKRIQHIFTGRTDHA